MARRIFISMILSAAVVASGALAAGNRTVALHTTAPADPSEFGRADRTYIYSNGATEMDMLKLRDELIAAGARAVNTFLPDNVIVAELPVTRDVSGILASAPVRQMSEQQVLALGSSAARRM